jgi:predicted O-methyltransferase YrrM
MRPHIRRTTKIADSSSLHELRDYRDTVFRLYPDLPRLTEYHMSIKDIDALALTRFVERLPRETFVLEIGTFVGVSAFLFAGQAMVSQVLTVDTNPTLFELGEEWGQNRGRTKVQEIATKTLAQFPDRARKVEFLEGTANNIDLSLPSEAPLVAFVDGDHARSSVKADLRAIFSKHPQTLAILHDCRSHASVLGAAVEFVAANRSERCFRFFEGSEAGAPDLGLVYAERLSAEVDRMAPGVLADPGDSLWEAAAVLSEKWEQQWAMRNRLRKRVRRLKAELAEARDYE